MSDALGGLKCSRCGQWMPSDYVVDGVCHICDIKDDTRWKTHTSHYAPEIPGPPRGFCQKCGVRHENVYRCPVCWLAARTSWVEDCLTCEGTGMIDGRNCPDCLCGKVNLREAPL